MPVLRWSRSGTIPSARQQVPVLRRWPPGSRSGALPRATGKYERKRESRDPSTQAGPSDASGSFAHADLTIELWLWTGNDADAELICVTGREEMQAVDHMVVTAHE